MIFLDVEMPVMDGFEFLEKLHELNKNQLPVELFTNVMHPKNQQKAIQHKVKAFVEKPLSEEKIEQVFLTLTA